MYDQGLGALAAFFEPGGPITARHPDAPSLPTCFGIVDASLDALGIEAQRIRNAQRDELAAHQGVDAVEEIAGRNRNVCAQAQGVVLIDPGVVARLDAGLGHVGEARAGQAVETPAFRTVIAGRRGAVERTAALAPVEAAQV